MAENNTEVTLEQKVDFVRNRIGKEPLSDKDLMILLCDAVARTYTHQEKEYGRSE